jgi:hypothetical protein
MKLVREGDLIPTRVGTYCQLCIAIWNPAMKGGRVAEDFRKQESG